MLQLENLCLPTGRTLFDLAWTRRCEPAPAPAQVSLIAGQVRWLGEGHQFRMA